MLVGRRSKKKAVKTSCGRVITHEMKRNWRLKRVLNLGAIYPLPSRSTIHPKDDIEARGLKEKWSYELKKKIMDEGYKSEYPIMVFYRKESQKRNGHGKLIPGLDDVELEDLLKKGDVSHLVFEVFSGRHRSWCVLTLLDETESDEWSTIPAQVYFQPDYSADDETIEVLSAIGMEAASDAKAALDLSTLDKIEWCRKHLKLWARKKYGDGFTTLNDEIRKAYKSAQSATAESILGAKGTVVDGFLKIACKSQHEYEHICNLFRVDEPGRKIPHQTNVSWWLKSVALVPDVTLRITVYKALYNGRLSTKELKKECLRLQCK